MISAIAREKIAVMVETTSLSRWLWYLRTYIQQKAKIAWNRTTTTKNVLLLSYVFSKTDFSMCLFPMGNFVSSKGSFTCVKKLRLIIFKAYFMDVVQLHLGAKTHKPSKS